MKCRRWWFCFHEVLALQESFKGVYWRKGSVTLEFLGNLG